MESTASFWRPIYNLLESQVELLVVNAAHVKAVPGRKTDVKDAEWLAELLRHGLVRGSFILFPTQRQLRDLTRYRIHLIEERARLTNRVQVVLEDANIKLASVVTDVRGVSARAILHALMEGETDPQALPALARGRLGPNVISWRKPSSVASRPTTPSSSASNSRIWTTWRRRLRA